MKRNILMLIFAAIFAFTVGFTFTGCKQKAESPDEAAVEEQQDEEAAPAEEEAAKEEEAEKK